MCLYIFSEETPVVRFLVTTSRKQPLSLCILGGRLWQVQLYTQPKRTAHWFETTAFEALRYFLTLFTGKSPWNINLGNFFICYC